MSRARLVGLCALATICVIPVLVVERSWAAAGVAAIAFAFGARLIIGWTRG